MPGPRLQKWIEKQMDAGVSREEIKAQLLVKGWREAQIDQALNLLGVHPEHGHHHKIPEVDEKNPALRRLIMALCGLLALLLTAGAIYLFLNM